MAYGYLQLTSAARECGAGGSSLDLVPSYISVLITSPGGYSHYRWVFELFSNKLGLLTLEDLKALLIKDLGNTCRLREIM